jgi:3-dehydroquinate dehydratase II
MARILLLNGPNLNLLGGRETPLYGRVTLAEIEARLQALATELGHELEALQSNHEGVLIDAIQGAGARGIAFMLINPGGLTHTSVALRDACIAAAPPFIEVHVSNIWAREHFRQHSYLSDVAVGSVVGLGPGGYELALRGAADYLSERRGKP